MEILQQQIIISEQQNKWVEVRNTWSEWKTGTGRIPSTNGIPYFSDVCYLHNLSVTQGLLYGLLVSWSNTYPNGKIYLTDKQLQNMLNKGRTTIQEALKALISEGLISTIRREQNRKNPYTLEHEHKTNRIIKVSKPFGLSVSYDSKLQNLTAREKLVYQLAKEKKTVSEIQSLTGFKKRQRVTDIVRKLKLNTPKPDTNNLFTSHNLTRRTRKQVSNRKPIQEVPLLPKALYYSHLGFHVFPVKKDKTPAISSWKVFQTRKPTTKEIFSMFSGMKSNKFGIALCPVGFTVLDDDSIKHDLPGLQITSPLSATSGSGGKHYFFKSNGEKTSHAGTYDIISSTGYIILDPSPHKSGFSYTWDTKPTKKMLDNLPFMPEIPETKPVKTPEPKPEPLTFSITWDNQPAFSLEDYKYIPDGSRNNTMNRLVIRLLLRMDRQAAYNTAEKVNQTYLPALCNREFNNTFRSAYQYVQRLKMN